MCAIAGIINLPWETKILQQMLETMKFRGPDGQGTFHDRLCCLLHARLAIIDPDGGQQPMHLAWGGEEFTIVYNGELYNTKEIRYALEREGHSFLGHSDTEVVLHAYAQWGEVCLEQFNGIFAFAIWESNRKRLFLGRDRIGVKPLFYKLHHDGLVFASEIKTILTYPDVKPELDETGIAQIFLLGPGRIPGSGVFRGIQEIQAGHYAVYENQTLTVHPYWKLRDQEHRESFEETAEHVRWLVSDAIKRQMVSDVPIGTFLSGGLDSSLISSICGAEFAEKGLQLQTFSVDYQDNDKYFKPGKFQPNADTHYIQLMQHTLHSAHHWTVLRPEELLEELENATVARDLPGMADVDFSLLAFCRQIRKHVKVALSGECADEIFGGYPWYRDPEVRETAGFPWAQNLNQRVMLLQPGVLKGICAEDFVRAQYEKTCQNSDILPGTSALDRRMKEMVNLNFQWFMQTLLDRKDRMSMATGLEVRVPFCDYRIAEYLYTVPWKFKDYQGQEKGLLRYAMKGLLPEEVLWRKKSPYPKTHDPLYGKLVQNRMEQLMQKQDAPLFNLVQRDQLIKLMHQDSPWPWYGQLMRTPQTVAYMLQINDWLEYYNITVL